MDCGCEYIRGKGLLQGYSDRQCQHRQPVQTAEADLVDESLDDANSEGDSQAAETSTNVSSTPIENATAILSLPGVVEEFCGRGKWRMEENFSSFGDATPSSNSSDFFPSISSGRN